MMTESETRVTNPVSNLISTFYLNSIVLGLEPGERVKVWLRGIPQRAPYLITQVQSKEVTNSNHYCQPWWSDENKTYIPKLHQESLDWIKANGVPSFD